MKTAPGLSLKKPARTSPERAPGRLSWPDSRSARDDGADEGAAVLERLYFSGRRYRRDDSHP
eukprot:11901642-Alexandrium_andersonii.AAC.1